MGQDVNTCSAVCSFAPHSQPAVKAIPRLYASEWNIPTPVCGWLSLTHTGVGKPIPGGAGLTSFINEAEKYSLATPCSICILLIVLHWCLTGRGHSAVPVQQAQMGVLI